MKHRHPFFRPRVRRVALPVLAAPLWVYTYYRPGLFSLMTAGAVTGVLVIVAGYLSMRPVHVAMKRLGKLRGAMCTSCGFDLRGLPPSGSCPECGAAYHIEEHTSQGLDAK
jgi:hypothetical protein